MLIASMRGKMRYFLDESGHGGDLSSAAMLDFAGQTVFALPFVGVDDEAGLREEPRAGAPVPASDFKQRQF
jgi:hypothetical protein